LRHIEKHHPEDKEALMGKALFEYCTSEEVKFEEHIDKVNMMAVRFGNA
jgi:hypothetical protein